MTTTESSAETTPVISDDLVEKAAKAMWDGSPLAFGRSWPMVHPMDRQHYLNRARAALEAVADDLRAEVLREVVVAIDKQVAENDSSTSPVDEAYVDGLTDALLVVRKRADALRSERAQ